MNMLSPLRYPGGKSRVAAYIRRIIEVNDLTDGHYVEPYAGGAGVALSLLMSDVVLMVHINDVDRAIYTFWDTIVRRTDEFCSRISDVALDVDEWHRQRAVQIADDPEPLDLAVSTFYLNRTNRSGIIQRGGVIGGLNQTGKWKIDARFNRDDLIRRIERVARYRSRIRVTNMDAVDLLSTLEASHLAKVFYYLDPPYYVKGKGLYANSYAHSDHLAVSDRVSRLSQPWIVSYDNIEAIRAMYSPYRKLEYSLGYSAREKYQGQEIMFFSDCLTIPDLTSPCATRRGHRRTQAMAVSSA